MCSNDKRSTFWTPSGGLANPPPGAAAAPGAVQQFSGHSRPPRKESGYEEGFDRGDQRSVASLATIQFTLNPGPESARGCSFYRKCLQGFTAAARRGRAARERVSGRLARRTAVSGVLSAPALSVSLVNSRPPSYYNAHRAVNEHASDPGLSLPRPKIQRTPRTAS